MDHVSVEAFSDNLDADLKSYRDTIPHGRLMDRLGERIVDGRVLRLIGSFLKAGILDGLKEWAPLGLECSGLATIPQGLAPPSIGWPPRWGSERTRIAP